MRKLISIAILCMFAIFGVSQTSYSTTEGELIKLLLHFNGSDGSNAFTDDAGKTVSAYGNAQIDTAQSKFGGASALFDGSGDYLSIPDSDDFYFSTGDFTIDFWIRFNSLTGNQQICGQFSSGSNFWYLTKTSNNKIQLYVVVGGVEKVFYCTDPYIIAANTWYHIEFCRNGSTAFIFLDGIKQTTTAYTPFGTGDMGNISSPFFVGQNGDNVSFVNGWIEEFRVSKGIARHTANFTPPTNPYSIVAASNVPHLINYQGRLTNTNGNPLNGSYNLTFRIYDAETAGNLLWEETHTGTVIQKGVFSLMLGSVVNLDLPFDTQYFLEIKVGTEVMSPRQKISSAGYAIRSATSEIAESANNSQTVGNVGVSTTPQPNKILPLDSNAKIPQSAINLKVYDSGWFGIATASQYTKIHNLGTTKIIVSVWANTNPTDNGAFLVNFYHKTNPDLNDVTGNPSVQIIDYNTLKIYTGNQMLFSYCNSAGEYTGVSSSAYLRIVILALE